MYFQAETLGKKFEIIVTEERDLWRVTVAPHEGQTEVFEVLKSDYQYLDNTISFLFKDSSYLVDVVDSGIDYSVYTRGSYREIKIFNEESLLHESLKGDQGFAGGDEMVAGMPGKIAKVFVKTGESVAEGQPVLVLEAMKMENEIRAPRAGVIRDIFFKEGASVERGATLVSFEKS